MRAPSPAMLASVALHAGLAALLLVSWPNAKPLPLQNSAVPVSIISSVEIAAAAPDNPAEELIMEDGATAPVEAPAAPPEPTPPAPTPPAPRPEPTPRPAPLRPVPPPPTRPVPPEASPPRAVPAAPAPARPVPPSRSPGRTAPSLDLDALAGPPRPRPNPGRAATGQQGAGQAAQATGPQIQAILRQVIPNWQLPCDSPGARELRIRVNLTLSADGSITSGPRLLDQRSDPIFRATADGALRAIRQTAPFDVPQGFQGAEFNPTFNVEQACMNQ